jgi:hypothetical protein
MVELTSGINWSAVVAGASLSFLSGWLWYSPRFLGSRWASAVNVEYSKTLPVAPMAMHFAGMVLLSWFVGVMAREGMLATTILLTIAVAVLGYAEDGYVKVRTDGKLINAGFWVVMVMVMVASQALVPAM